MPGSLWDLVPGSGSPDAGLQRAADLLRLLDATGATHTDTLGPPRRTWRESVRPADLQQLQFDPLAGRFGTRTAAASNPLPANLGNFLEFPDPSIDYVLAVDYTDTTYTTPAGPWSLTLTLPRALLRLPGLRGARRDPRGFLVPDPATPQVVFHLPSVALRVASDGSTTTSKVVSASTSGGAGAAGLGDPPAEDVYEFARMEPPYALVGPGAVFGFGFRTAVLDLSDTVTPGTPPPGVGPDWHGVWLPEARIFVSPNGMQDLAVDGGVRDLYVGIGEHHGVSGTFELEVVNRGHAPTVRLRFVDDAGRGFPPAADGSYALPEHVTVIAEAQGGIAPYSYAFAGGAAGPTDRQALTVSPAGDSTVSVSVTDGGGHATTATATVRRRGTSPGTVPGGTEPAQVTTTSTGTTRLNFVGQADTTVTLALDPAPVGGGTITWTWPGGGPVTGDTATIPVGAGVTVDVTVAVPAAGTRTRQCYFRFRHPEGTAGDPHDQDTSTAPAADLGAAAQFTGGMQPFDGLGRDVAPDGTTVTVQGFASYDGQTDTGAADRNRALSARRQAVLTALLAARGGLTVTQGTPDGFTTALADGHRLSDPNDWRADVTWTPPGSGEHVTGQVTRAPGPPPQRAVDNDPEPPARPSRPSWFRAAGASVTLVRSTFVRCEVWAEIDVQTAAEDRIHGSGQYFSAVPGTPPDPNAMDGVMRIDVRLVVDEATSDWRVEASLRAADADRDGLAQAKRPEVGGHPQAGSIPALDAAGAYASLAPVLAAVSPSSPEHADYGPLVLGALAIGAATAVLRTRTLTLRGGEIDVSRHDDTDEVVLLLDVETKLGFDAGVIRVSLDNPITVRYKAVGFSFSWTDSQAYLFRTVFDASKGYTLDIPQGAVGADPPLGDLLQVLGTRVSRDNPTYVEVDLGIGADLGIVSVDRARVRMNVAGGELPQLTALGASVDVPGVLHGRGYLSVTAGGFAGSIDVTLQTPPLRVAAALKVATDPVTGVFVGVEVDFPVPILLGSSGLGIYGLLGAIGVNFARDENPAAAIPALDWLVNRAHGDPFMQPDAWVARQGSFVIGLGAVLGTAEGGFLINLKGILLLELPGPRLLLIMRADVLKGRPGMRGSQQATFLAVVDIGPDGLFVGLVAEYSIIELVRVRVPVQAAFPTANPQNWLIDLGTYLDPVTVSVFGVFTGSGYLMLHGNGLRDRLGNPLPSPPISDVPANGVTVAVGAHAAFVWGSEDIGLYLKIAGGFDLVLSFSPVALGGRLELSGELRLFIVSIGASASLDVHAGKQVVGDHTEEHTYATGEICGHVDFFFFSVEGCVSFTLGDTDPPPPQPDPLVSGVVLVSRSPAHTEGSGTDRAVDGRVADAAGPGDAAPQVPLDIIPVLMLDVVPNLADPHPFQVLGKPVNGTPEGPADPWVLRGRTWWRYELQSVTLTGALAAGGDHPTTWWKRRGAATDRLAGASLALLDWLPAASPRAVPYGNELVTTVTEDWGSICDPVAPPAPVLWTFLAQPLGPSTAGWHLHGTPWPDDPGTVRSTPVDGRLLVTERWRCGNAAADGLRGIAPARVVGGPVPCPRSVDDPTLPGFSAGLGAGPTSLSGLLGTAGGLFGASEAVAAGTGLPDLLAAATDTVEVAALHADKRCDGRVLRSPAGDGKDPVQGGDPAAEPQVVAAWELAGFVPDELVDAVVLRTDGLQALTVLVLLTERMLNRGLWFRTEAADGTELDRQPVEPSDFLTAARMPARWWDPGGPWRDAVERAGRAAATASRSDPQGYLLALVEVKVPDGTANVVVGTDPGLDPGPHKGQRAAPFYLCAAEGLLASEGLRWSWDDTVRQDRIQGLSTALSQDPDDHAMLLPGVTYELAATWQAWSVEATTRPTDPTAGVTTGAVTQTFSFVGEDAAHAPTRLEPWVLHVAPGADERGVFCDDPVVVAFATQSVARLFAAYGEELHLTLRSASGRHPHADGTRGSLASVVLDPFPVGGASMTVMSPWEEAVRGLVADAGLGCVDPGSRTTVATSVIPFPLEPCTDYLLDIERVPAAGGTGIRVYRRGFTTGRFASLQALADLLAGVALEHLPVRDRTPLDALPLQPTGEQVDQAFRAAGLPTPGVPGVPRVVVLWDAAAQPAAVLVDGPDPLWRSRPLPVQVTDPTDPTRHWWVEQLSPWLSYGAAGSAPVTGVVRCPGDARALVRLGPGARGTELKMMLTRAADALTGDAGGAVAAGAVTFVRPPWEDPEP